VQIFFISDEGHGTDEHGRNLLFIHLRPNGGDLEQSDAQNEKRILDGHSLPTYEQASPNESSLYTPPSQPALALRHIYDFHRQPELLRLHAILITLILIVVTPKCSTAIWARCIWFVIWILTPGLLLGFRRLIAIREEGTLQERKVLHMTRTLAVLVWLCTWAAGMMVCRERMRCAGQ
jgi:hypothetical protein